MLEHTTTKREIEVTTESETGTPTVTGHGPSSTTEGTLTKPPGTGGTTAEVSQTTEGTPMQQAPATGMGEQETQTETIGKKPT